MTEAAAESTLPVLPSTTTDHTTLVLPVPGVHTATPLSLACTNFALQMVCLMGPKFNLRRDVNDVLTATGVTCTGRSPSCSASSAISPIAIKTSRAGKASAS